MVMVDRRVPDDLIGQSKTLKVHGHLSIWWAQSTKQLPWMTRKSKRGPSKWTVKVDRVLFPLWK